MQDIISKITNFKKLIIEELNHTYLTKHLNSPVIDEDKLLLLYTIFEEIEIGESEIEQYALATMLIQLALDTHDQVKTRSVNQSNELLENQLTVLAGDYFSGLYYSFLARIGEIGLVRSLAEGTKEVNEQKIKLYQGDLKKIDAILNCIELIEATLLKKVTKYFHLSKWDTFISKFLLLKRLVNEREAYYQGNQSIVVNLVKNIINVRPEANHTVSKSNDGVLLSLDLQISNLKEYLVNFLTQEPSINKVLQERVQDLVDTKTEQYTTFKYKG
ncbi:heptaprenyl diphosphate synthase component 1 [Litchfieldia alkalitelluris]|uniref:heptaprenyl diphosphate synthase component 1 n=1 Tax=Litchfieldia alkalitelluris TaxID=304268 RepID=UPI0009976C11|nr:heptaprenyl diphosphate synthase component 1 [Litchfieldia alkalitelluris]